MNNCRVVWHSVFVNSVTSTKMVSFAQCDTESFCLRQARRQRRAWFQPSRPPRIYWPQRRQRKRRNARCVHVCGLKGLCRWAHVGTSLICYDDDDRNFLRYLSMCLHIMEYMVGEVAKHLRNPRLNNRQQYIWLGCALQQMHLCMWVGIQWGISWKNVDLALRPPGEVLCQHTVWIPC